MPSAEVAGRIDESDVTARSGRLKEQVRIPFRLGVRERFWSEEGIIPRVQEKCGNLDSIQILPRARFLPVLLRIPKTMDRRRIEVIEFPQRSDPVAPAGIQTVREDAAIWL